MQPRPLVGEHATQENSLIDLDPVLVPLIKRCLGVDFIARGHQPRKRFRCEIDELFNPNEARAAGSQFAIDGRSVCREKAITCGARRGKNRIGSSALDLVTARFLRQAREQPRGL